MNTLGGWWRLWIVISVLWLAFALIVAIPNASPSTKVGDDLLTGTQVVNLEASRNAIRARVSGRCLPTSITTKGVAKLGNPFDAFETYEDKPELSAEQLGYPQLPPDFHLDQPARPAKPMQYMRVTTTCVAWSWLGFVILFAFGPPAFLLLIAIAGRWIWRGFRPA